MAHESDLARPDAAQSARFPTTRWSLVAAAGRADQPQARAALGELCQTYWFPLYAYARRLAGAQQAEDLTQEFFARLLAKNDFAMAQRERGRFRAFLLAAFQHFVANQRDKARAAKRGGGRSPISLDFSIARRRCAAEPADELTPERIFERQWALTLLDRVLARLREEYASAGKPDHFERLKGFLTAQSGTDSHAAAARDLGTTEGALKVAVHRMRRRYRALLRAEIAQTVAGPGEVEQEIRSLFGALGG